MLERWRADALSMPARERAWTAPARFDAVLTTAAMDEASRNAWCREHGVCPQELERWRQAATQALADPEEVRASPQQTKQDRHRIHELERELRRKGKFLAETAALPAACEPEHRCQPRAQQTRPATAYRQSGRVDFFPALA